MPSLSIAGVWLNLYWHIFMLISIIILFRWWKKLNPRTPLKRQATIFGISILFPVLLGTVTDILPEILGGVLFPKLRIVFSIIPTTALFFALKNFGLLLEKSPVPLFHENDNSSVSRLRLFQTASAIYIIGSAASFAIAFFGMKRDLKYELLLSAVILICGIFTRYIPTITKNLQTQNILFLIICIIGLSFFVFINAETGAVTVWAVFVVFMLFTIVLDSKHHTLIFVIIAIATQIILGIIQPEVAVTININE